MKMTFFIDRPIFSVVLSILIVVVGCIGLYLLPVDQYPQITPPMVKISASYPGAGASTVSQAVATPIEQELNGTPGMLYMDISQAEYKLRLAHAKVGIAFTSMFPKVTLTGHYGLESGDLSRFLKSPYFFLGGELLEPVFNMGKNRARLRAAKAVREQEVYAYQKVVLNAFSEVSNALIASGKNREIRESRKNPEEAARSALDLATLQYINGIISYLDVLDAQRGYFDARIGLNNAIRDELLATVQLYKVLGGGANETTFRSEK